MLVNIFRNGGLIGWVRRCLEQSEQRLLTVVLDEGADLSQRVHTLLFPLTLQERCQNGEEWIDIPCRDRVQVLPATEDGEIHAYDISRLFAALESRARAQVRLLTASGKMLDIYDASSALLQKLREYNINSLPEDLPPPYRVFRDPIGHTFQYDDGDISLEAYQADNLKSFMGSRGIPYDTVEDPTW